MGIWVDFFFFLKKNGFSIQLSVSESDGCLPHYKNNYICKGENKAHRVTQNQPLKDGFTSLLKQDVEYH